MQRKQKLSMKDVLLWSQGEPSRPGPRRIGIHTSTSGGIEQAAERAYRLGANAFQIFSSSPRQWKPYSLATSQCEQMRRMTASSQRCVEIPARAVREGGDNLRRQDRDVLDRVNGDPPLGEEGSLPS